MAKTPETDAKRPKSVVKEAAVWIMMGMLILGLGGFGVTNFGGTVSTVGTVGKVEITADDYARGVPEPAERLLAAGRTADLGAGGDRLRA